MYQPKVNSTQKYEDSQGSHVVTTGKLILITGIKEEVFASCSSIEEYKGKIKPIIISETEEIEVGDKALMSGEIVTAAKPTIKDEYKILALPEHFSDKHLQAIVDGKMQDGDEVLIKLSGRKNTIVSGGLRSMGEVGGKPPTSETNKWYVVYLNQQNHITLFPAKQPQDSLFSNEELDLIKQAVHQYAQKMPKSNYHKKVIDKLNKIGNKLTNISVKQSLEEVATQKAEERIKIIGTTIGADDFKVGFKAGAEWAKKNNY